MIVKRLHLLLLLLLLGGCHNMKPGILFSNKSGEAVFIHAQKASSRKIEPGETVNYRGWYFHQDKPVRLDIEAGGTRHQYEIPKARPAQYIEDRSSAWADHEVTFGLVLNSDGAIYAVHPTDTDSLPEQVGGFPAYPLTATAASRPSVTEENYQHYSAHEVMMNDLQVHTKQAKYLGPFYFPLHIIGSMSSAILWSLDDGEFHWGIPLGSGFGPYKDVWHKFNFVDNRIHKSGTTSAAEAANR